MNGWSCELQSRTENELLAAAPTIVSHIFHPDFAKADFDFNIER